MQGVGGRTVPYRVFFLCRGRHNRQHHNMNMRTMESRKNTRKDEKDRCYLHSPENKEVTPNTSIVLSFFSLFFVNKPGRFLAVFFFLSYCFVFFTRSGRVFSICFSLTLWLLFFFSFFFTNQALLFLFLLSLLVVVLTETCTRPPESRRRRTCASSAKRVATSLSATRARAGPAA